MRRQWLVAALLVTTLVVLAAILTLRSTGDDDAPAPIDRGASACALLRRLDDQVRANDTAADVLRTVDAAVARARDEADRDPARIPLLGALEAIRIGLENNDAGAAGIGIRSARAQCPAAPPPSETAP